MTENKPGNLHLKNGTHLGKRHENLWVEMQQVEFSFHLAVHNLGHLHKCAGVRRTCGSIMCNYIIKEPSSVRNNSYQDTTLRSLVLLGSHPVTLIIHL